MKIIIIWRNSGSSKMPFFRCAAPLKVILATQIMLVVINISCCCSFNLILLFAFLKAIMYKKSMCCKSFVVYAGPVLWQVLNHMKKSKVGIWLKVFFAVYAVCWQVLNFANTCCLLTKLAS